MNTLGKPPVGRFTAAMGTIHRLIREEGVEKARAVAVSRAERQAVEAAFRLMIDEEVRIGLTHAGFAMAALPHQRTEELLWEKDGGSIKLLVESGLDRHKQPVGLPYGSLARLILLYLQTQAVRTRSREVELGASMGAWLKVMGIPKSGPTYARVREQSTRISRCRLTFFRRAAGAEMVSNGAFVRDAILPDDSANPGQLSLWRETVTLDEGFYRSLIDHPLPLREAAIRAVSGRSMAIDFYVWLAYRLRALGEPVGVTWPALRTQFGGGYAEIRFFRRDAQTSLALALAAYPEARVEVDAEKGLTLYPSPPPVAERRSLA